MEGYDRVDLPQGRNGVACAANDLIQSEGEDREAKAANAASVPPTEHNTAAHKHADLAEAALLFMLDAPLSNNDDKHDFAPVAFAQQLTMSFAHLSAFVADSVRAICYARPAVLKSDRKLEWRTIIEAGDWSEVFRHLVEAYVFSFGWDSIKKCVLAMRDRFGLTLGATDDVLERIDEAELLRNVVIHEGGRVSAEYLRRSGRHDVQLGDLLPIDPAFIQRVSRDMLYLGGQILLDVSSVHFGRDPRAITRVWLRGERSANTNENSEH